MQKTPIKLHLPQENYNAPPTLHNPLCVYACVCINVYACGDMTTCKPASRAPHSLLRSPVSLRSPTTQPASQPPTLAPTD